MRTEKFDNSKDAYESDDIKYAFEYNSLAHRLNDIDVIVAEVCGENDGFPWYWILQMKDGTFSWATGGCDYSGGDCQSNAEIHDGFASAYDAITALSVDEYDSRKNIKVCLSKQITGEIPFAIYDDSKSL